MMPVRHVSVPVLARANRLKFGNGAAMALRVAEPAVNNFWLRAWQFLTSRETFYRFWTEILAAVVSGMFLLASAKMRLKEAATAHKGPSLETQAYLQPMLRRVARPARIGAKAGFANFYT